MLVCNTNTCISCNLHPLVLLRLHSANRHYECSSLWIWVIVSSALTYFLGVLHWQTLLGHPQAVHRGSGSYLTVGFSPRICVRSVGRTSCGSAGIVSFGRPVDDSAAPVLERWPPRVWWVRVRVATGFVGGHGSPVG